MEETREQVVLSSFYHLSIIVNALPQNSSPILISDISRSYMPSCGQEKLRSEQYAKVSFSLWKGLHPYYVLQDDLLGLPCIQHIYCLVHFSECTHNA